MNGSVTTSIWNGTRIVLSVIGFAAVLNYLIQLRAAIIEKKGQDEIWNISTNYVRQSTPPEKS